MDKELRERSGGNCELCGATGASNIYEVPPVSNRDADGYVLTCKTCLDQIETPALMDAQHWRCLNDSMWSQIPAVQVTAWRMLTRLKSESWAQDLLNMLYLEDEILNWAQETDAESDEDVEDPHLDSNGSILEAGDTVILIKDLPVKGAGFTAKRGTAVRGISLVPGNPDQIEGRVSNQQIVILTKFVKKS